MDHRIARRTVGLLFSGGLDSAILLHELIESGYQVQPLYVRCGLRWEATELAAARSYLESVQQEHRAELVEVVSPLADLYGTHWSVNSTGPAGQIIPGYDSPDSEVFLPGRNLMLIAPAGLWCQLRGIEQLAIGILGNNPFNDAAESFFDQLEVVLRQSHSSPIQLWQPLRESAKKSLMQAAAEFPLERTFSCLAPVEQMHCGQCNKCAERQRAFRESGVTDRTEYAQESVAVK